MGPVTEAYALRLIRSKRKTLALQIGGPGLVIVRAPLRAKEETIRAFVAQHEGWLNSHLEKARLREAQRQALPPFTPEELKALARQAAETLPGIVDQYAAALGVRYGRIAIRCQKSKWGSCSAQGNLSFNCLLMACPREALEYVAAHEVCHLKEMNHSPRFWRLVEQLLPDYVPRRQWLKTEGQQLIERLPR